MLSEIVSFNRELERERKKELGADYSAWILDYFGPNKLRVTEMSRHISGSVESCMRMFQAIIMLVVPAPVVHYPS